MFGLPGTFRRMDISNKVPYRDHFAPGSLKISRTLKKHVGVNKLNPKSNKIDKANSDTSLTLNSMDKFGLNPVPIQLPLPDGRVFCLLSNAIISSGDQNLSLDDLTRIKSAKYDLCERVSLFDDSICEMFLNEEIPSNEDLSNAIEKGYYKCKATPVLFGSAKNNLGVSALIDFKARYPYVPIKTPFKRNLIEEEPVAYAFKVTNDRRLGEGRIFYFSV